MKSKKPNALFADINIHFLTCFSVQFSGMFVTVILLSRTFSLFQCWSTFFLKALVQIKTSAFTHSKLSEKNNKKAPVPAQ